MGVQAVRIGFRIATGEPWFGEESFRYVEQDLNKVPKRSVLDGEPSYEMAIGSSHMLIMKELMEKIDFANSMPMQNILDKSNWKEQNKTIRISPLAEKTAYYFTVTAANHLNC